MSPVLLPYSRPLTSPPFPVQLFLMLFPLPGMPFLVTPCSPIPASIKPISNASSSARKVFPDWFNLLRSGFPLPEILHPTVIFYLPTDCEHLSGPPLGYLRGWFIFVHPHPTPTVAWYVLNKSLSKVTWQEKLGRATSPFLTNPIVL